MAKNKDRDPDRPLDDDEDRVDAADEPDRRDPNEGDPLHPNPPYTVTKRMIAPKFGSAGSGGAENEPGPERD